MHPAQLDQGIRIRVRKSLQHIKISPAWKQFRHVCIVVHTLFVPHVIYSTRLQHAQANPKQHVAGKKEVAEFVSEIPLGL